MGKRSKGASGSSTKTAASVPAAAATLPSSSDDAAFQLEQANILAGSRLSELLDSLKCRPVLERLQAQGYSQNVAQRACLEVHQAKKEVTYDSAVKWIRRHDISKIDKPLQPLELLKYLSEIVVGMLERLPKPDASHHLQHTLLATDLRPSAAAVSSQSACSSSALPAGSAAGAGTSDSGAVAGAGGSTTYPGCDVRQLLLHPDFAAALTTDSELLSKLMAAEAAEVDLEAVLAQLDSLATDPALPAAAAAAAQPSSSPKALAGASDGTQASGTSAAASPRSSAGGQAEAQSAGFAGDDCAGSSSGAAGSGSFAGRMAQQMLGLQQQVSRAMQSLASLRRSSSSKAPGAADGGVEVGEDYQQAASALLQHQGQLTAGQGTSRGSAGEAAELGATAAAAASPRHAARELPAEQQALVLHEQLLSRRQLSEQQLASLKLMLGPGVEVYTAEQYRQHNPGADYDALPAIDLHLLSSSQAGASSAASAAGPCAGAGGCSAPAAAGSGGGAGADSAGDPCALSAAERPADPQSAPEESLMQELSSLRQHRRWADQRIAQLIRRVSDAERPVREEAAKLLAEVQALRVEKEGMKAKLRELERSIGKIKESTYAEVQQKREYERQAAIAAADLKAAGLREAEAAAEVRSLQKQLAAEKKRREAAEAEARSKRSNSDAAQTAAAAAAAAAREEAEGLRRQLRQQQQAAEERLAAAEAAEAAAARAVARAVSTEDAAKSKCDVLAAEKASLIAALEEAEKEKKQLLEEAEQERRVLQEQLATAQHRTDQLQAAVQGLQQRLAAAQGEAAAAAQRAAQADARALAAGTAAEAAKQQLAALLTSQRQQQQQRGILLASPEHQQLAAPAAGGTMPPAAPVLASEGSATASLFGGSSLWGGGGLFGSGLLDAPAPTVSSPAPSASGPVSASMGSSSPMSQSGAATPQHSMHSSSIANSPVAPRQGALGLTTGQLLNGSSLLPGGRAGGSLFGDAAGLQSTAAAAFAGADLAFAGAGSSSLLLPDPHNIWGSDGGVGAGVSTSQQLFPPPQALH